MCTNGTLLRSLVTVLLVAAPSKGEPPFCLPDADGDGHPIFGNPEVMMNPSAPVAGLSDMLATAARLGDLDADGDVDAAAVYAWYNPEEADITEVSILLNNGDGTFVAVATYACGDYPTSVAIGDLDGDGLNDLAITNTSSGQVSVLVNAGGATFPTRASYPAGLKPHSSVIADLDGDGDNDLAVMNAGDETVTIFLNDGAGGFSLLATLPVSDIPDQSAYPTEPYAFGGPYLTAGDLDGDTFVDLIVPAAAGVSVLTNAGAGAFAPYVLYPAESSVWASDVGDIDGDGTQDVVTANHSANSVSVLCNMGNGGLAPPISYTLIFGVASGVYNPNSVDLGDLDEDGDLDIIAPTNGSYEHLPILLNNGDGTFGSPLPQEADQATGFAQFEHINSDDHLDAAAFVLTEPGRDKMCVLLGDGTGLLTDEANYNVYVAQDPWYWVNCQRVSVAHMNADDILDMIALNEGAASLGIAPNIAVLLGSGLGSFSEGAHFDVPGFVPNSMTVADLDDDDDLDVAVAGPLDTTTWSPGYLAVFLNAGDGMLSFSASYLTGGTYPVDIQANDLDGDGDSDLVTSNLFTGDLSVFLNAGDASFIPLPPQECEDVDAGFIAVGDLDGDSVPDLAVQEFYGVPGVTILTGNGDGTFSYASTVTVLPHATQPVLADFDSDNDLDIAVASFNSPDEPTTMTVLTNDGAGMFVGTSYWSPGTRHARVSLAQDINLDGDVDLTVSTDAGISVFLNDGDGTFAWPYAYGAGQDIQGLAAGDLDGDGDVDVISAHHASETFGVHWNMRCIVVPGDVDGDADVDLDDYSAFLVCLSGPLSTILPTNCSPAQSGQADFDGDGDVDARDFAVVQTAFSGSAGP